MPISRSLLLFLPFLILHPVIPSVQAADADPVEGGYGMLRGPGYAFLVKAPTSWMIDPKSGQAQGLPAVFYPKGGSWEASPAVAYARSRPRTKEVSTVEEVVASVVSANRAQGNPGYEATLLKTIRSASGKEGVIYRFHGAKSGEVEATAYFPEKRTIDFVTLSATSDQILEAAMSSFEELASSYDFQPDKIPVDSSKKGFFQDEKDGTPKD